MRRVGLDEAGRVRRPFGVQESGTRCAWVNGSHRAAVSGMAMRPEVVLELHGLPATGVRPVGGGNVNRVWVTEHHVVRLGAVTDHAREARLALAARAVGVTTPRPVAWGAAYGIWERLAGSPPAAGGVVAAGVWSALLDDLAVLHANPLEDVGDGAGRGWWRGRASLVEATQAEAAWTSGERQRLRSALGGGFAEPSPVLVHGDAYAGNVLVGDDGAYVALVDWGCAAWASLEAECARLEDEALELALARWAAVDGALLWRMRLDLFLEVAWRGRMSFGRVRRLLERGPFGS